MCVFPLFTVRFFTDPQVTHFGGFGFGFLIHLNTTFLEDETSRKKKGHVRRATHKQRETYSVHFLSSMSREAESRFESHDISCQSSRESREAMVQKVPCCKSSRAQGICVTPAC